MSELLSSEERLRIEPSALTSTQLTFKRVANLSQLVRSWVDARQALLTSHYGLSDSKYLPIEYRRIIGHQYFQVTRGTEVIAVLRMIPKIPMLKYHRNLTPELLAAVLRGVEFCDLGLYYLSESKEFSRMHVVREALQFSATVAATAGMKGIYLQVPFKHRKFYERMSFLVAGKPFLPEGWNQIYLPLYRLSP